MSVERAVLRSLVRMQEHAQCSKLPASSIRKIWGNRRGGIMRQTCVWSHGLDGAIGASPPTSDDPRAILRETAAVSAFAKGRLWACWLIRLGKPNGLYMTL